MDDLSSVMKWADWLAPLAAGRTIEETMNVPDIIEDSSAKWDRELPAEPKVIQQLLAESEIDLPEEYLTLLRHSNGGEGELDVEPGWFQLWPAEQVVEFNRGYEVAKNAPGIFGFGSNGGGEMLAFDMRCGEPWRIVMIPFIPMRIEDAKVIADDFGTFVQSMGRRPSS
jgi:hypothetical protein